MKRIRTIFALCLLCMSFSHSQAQDFIRIKNRWQKDGKTDYRIHIQNPSVAAGATEGNWWSAQWALEKVPGTDFYKIRNRWQKDGKTQYYLHIEQGKLEAGAIHPDWWSAQWKLIKVNGTPYYRIQNRWKPDQYLHIEGPALAAGKIDMNWWSAQWELEGFNGTVAQEKKEVAQKQPASPGKEVIEERPTAHASVSSVAWITRYYDFLKDKPLNRIVLPGSHDSGTHNLNGTWLRGVDDPFAPDTDDLKRGLSFLGDGYDKWAKAQERSIYQQLTDGIRYLDIRVCVDKSDQLKTCHGLYGVSLTEVINDVVKFTNQYPKEPILIDFNHFYDWEEKIRNGKEDEAGYTGIRTAMLDKLAGMIERSIGGKLAPNSLNPTSTLKELMNTGRPIIVLWDKTPRGSFQQTYFWRSSEIVNAYSNQIAEIRMDKINHLDKMIRANQNSSTFFSLTGQITPSHDLYKRAYDFTGTYPFGLENLAKQTNPVVLSYVANEWRNLKHNIIAIDFYNQTSLVELCKDLNGIPANPTGVSKADRDKSDWGKWKLGAGQLFAGSTTNEWRVEIDACHSELDHTDTGDRITVQFWSGPDRIASKYMDGVRDVCKIWSTNATFSIETNRKITHVIVKTDGEDAFYIDEIYLYHGGELKQHHGRDDGGGWCLSKQAGDSSGDWKAYTAGSCVARKTFEY